jgi:hypothetical protein
MTPEYFKNLFTPADFPPLLQALWHDAHGDWHKAHDIAQAIETPDGAWLHAYLHRKEGDVWNADYWYRRAGRVRPNSSLETEWEQLVQYFIK